MAFKKVYLLVTVLILVVTGIAAGAFFYYQSAGNSIRPIACTQDAMQCADGSYVSRQGPECEFAPCPSEALCEGEKCPDVTTIGTIKGKVEVGPICPVEQEGVPCPTPPEAYTSREVILYAANRVTVVKRTHFNADGTYLFEVPAGTYVLDTPAEGIGGSGDVPETITVKSGETVEFNFSIDTGIR